MKEFVSAFSSEVFRPLVTLIAPGAFALSTWSIGAFSKFEVLRHLAQQHRPEAVVLFVFACLLVGLLLEAVGSTVEGELFDKWIVKKQGREKHMQEWYEYLRLAFRVEPVGHRYMRTLVLHLKWNRISSRCNRYFLYAPLNVFLLDVDNLCCCYWDLSSVL
jgi:hypothetical protein